MNNSECISNDISDDDERFNDTGPYPMDQRATRIMPEFECKLGRRVNHSITVKSLCDSGSYSNLISKKAFRKSGAKKIECNNLPNFILADGSHTKPLGLCLVRVWFTDTTSANLYAFIVPDQDIDFTLGSLESQSRDLILDYTKMTITLKACYNSFQC